MGDPEDRWYFPKDRLNESPSRKDGYSAEKELSCRQQAANFIQDMGQKLQVSQLCINTAIVYMHRFYVFHSLVQFHRNAIATAALFLAAKVEEQPRKVEHVLKVAHLCLHRENPSLEVKSDLYQEQSNDLVVNESILLQTLGFDVAIDHPHTHVVRCCQLVKASKDLAQTSYFMASNSLHLTTMCLQYKPTVVACFCIHLACKWSNWEIPRSSEGKDWFWYVNQSVTLDLLEQLTSEFLLIFDNCPTKLKKKMMSMNQNNPPVNFAHVPGTQESYHFDEPRKLMGAEANRPPEGFFQAQKLVEKSASAPNSNNSNAQPHGRHIDYKEYKEKKERERQERERAERERMHRGNAPPNQAGHSIPPHAMPKPVDKMKQQVAPQRPSSGVPPHKLYPQQRPPHAPKEGPPHVQRPPIKEAMKRKLDEMDGSQPTEQPQFSQDPNSKNYPRNPEEFRHKPQAHYPQPLDAHPPTKDLSTSGIRDIINQTFPRDKTHRPPEERQYQNYPYQRPPGMEKYPGNSRHPQQPPTKQHKEEANKKAEELLKPSHGMERYPNKAPMMSQPPPQQKVRDPKRPHPSMPPKDPTQKHPPNPIPPNVPSHKKPPEKVLEKPWKYHEPERGLPSLLEPIEDPPRPKVEQKRPHPSNDLHKKEKIPSSNSSKYPTSKPKPGNYFKPHEQQSLFDLPSNDMELPSLIDNIERPAKIARLEERKKPELKPLINLPGEMPKPKTSSIFSPDSNESPKVVLSSLDKDTRKNDLHFPQTKKTLSSLFSPPSLPSLMSHRSGSSSSSEREMPSSVPTSVIKCEPRHSEADRLNDQKMIKTEPPIGIVPAVPSIPSAVVAPMQMPAAPIASRPPVSMGHMAGAIIYPPSEKAKLAHAYQQPETSLTVETKPTVSSSPVSTVNLLGMEKMLDTSISSNISAVIKPLPAVKTETPQPKIPVPLPKEPEKKVEEKVKIPTEEGERQRRSEKKKSKDKDRDKESSHRHKDKKKSDGKKEKKKHKDKDKERKKDSHRDKERHKDRPKEETNESHLKITIPKDKLSLSSTEGIGLKIKIAKERLKPEDIDVTKLNPPQEGSLKIKIKKDVITSYKDEKTSKKESSSHSSHHKSSKSSKSENSSSKSSKKSDSRVKTE